MYCSFTCGTYCAVVLVDVNSTPAFTSAIKRTVYVRGMYIRVFDNCSRLNVTSWSTQGTLGYGVILIDFVFFFLSCRLEKGATAPSRHAIALMFPSKSDDRGYRLCLCFSCIHLAGFDSVHLFFSFFLFSFLPDFLRFSG